VDEQLKRSALHDHRLPTPGKMSIVPTKAMTNQHDLALAYSRGVAAACIAIFQDSAQGHNPASQGNLVAVVSNGTGVLGLGNIGPLAGKPVRCSRAEA
jgi:malate dehydrogenase (oxaloacetate-decarboxylating)(NADP+)